MSMLRAAFAVGARRAGASAPARRGVVSLGAAPDLLGTLAKCTRIYEADVAPVNEVVRGPMATRHAR